LEKEKKTMQIQFDRVKEGLREENTSLKE